MSKNRDIPGAMIGLSARRRPVGHEGKSLTNQVEHRARPFAPSLLWRASQALRRGVRELAARLWGALWQVVIVAVIMASLVTLGDLSVQLALAAFASFVGAVALLPRQDVDPALDREFRPSPVRSRVSSSMQVMSEALPDPVILLDRAGTNPADQRTQDYVTGRFG